MSDISLDLSNRVTLEVHTASYRTTRGYTIVAALLDELAFWPTEDTAEPDHEVINAIRPAMATSLVRCSCVHRPPMQGAARCGTLPPPLRAGRRFLVWQADTRTMNPTVPQAIIDRLTRTIRPVHQPSTARNSGPTWNASQPRSIDACVSVDVRERPPHRALRSAFVDPSGGRSDSMTLAIGHRDERAYRIDSIREVRPPFSPEGVGRIRRSAQELRVTRVHGDRYAGEWPVEQFRKHGIAYEGGAEAEERSVS